MRDTVDAARTDRRRLVMRTVLCAVSVSLAALASDAAIAQSVPIVRGEPEARREVPTSRMARQAVARRLIDTSLEASSARVEPLTVHAVQPLRFDQVQPGEARVVDAWRDDHTRAEFEVRGNGWVEVTVDASVAMNGVDQTVHLTLDPGDVILLDVTGRPVPYRLEELIVYGDVGRIRMTVYVENEVRLLVGGAIATDVDHAAGEYGARILVTARQLAD